MKISSFFSIKSRSLSIFSVCLIVFLMACSKEEPKTDCCPFSSGDTDNPLLFASVDVNGIPTRLGNVVLEKHGDWILLVENDTLMIRLNLGDGDSLGFRPLKTPYSEARLHNVPYGSLGEGRLLITAIDQEKQLLSFFFEAKFGMSEDAQWYNPLDSLFIKNGDFENIPWE